MKLRLKQPGWESYSGQMGVIQFVDGVSVGDVLEIDAVRVSAVMLCEWEDGTTASVAKRLVDEADTPAPSLERSKADDLAKVTAAQPKKEKPKFTEAELEKIADEKGINGLRELAEPFGIKSNSIRNLIDAMLKAAAE
ncbi:hypothetical protein PQQ87_08660 [Paraburkholderia nemoris]|uniref:hypothetical protein n=1 Tax=Paraburkholderia nemoris TaxID=2793076 RepID=UPI0038BADD74